MFKSWTVILVAVLACSSSSAAPSVRKFDDPGAPPFKVLKAAENPHSMWMAISSSARST